MQDSSGKQSSSDPPRIRLISATDVITAFGLAGMLPISWCLPQRGWKSIARLASPITTALALQSRENEQRIKSLIGDRPLVLTAKEIQRESMQHFVVENLRVLRDYRPGGWNPEIHLHGAEHIEAGLRKGRGVILWVAHVSAYSLVAKIALFRAGYAVNHLSLWRHGYSDTQFGVRFLNPIRTRIESRYLRQRVVIGPEGAKAAMMTLREQLRAGGIVSIAATSDAKRPAIVPFLNGSMRLAIGAPYLAFKEKSTLLPVFPIEQDDGRFTVEIAPPLENESAGSTEEYLNWATREYVALFEPYLLEKPGQWRGWFYL